MPLKICRSWCALVVVALFAAPLPAVAGDVAPEHHRVSVQVLDPNATPVNQWRIKVQASYRPLVQGSPNTTETTNTRANCSTGSRFGSLPSLRRCERTYDRSVTVKLPAAQIKTAGPRTLSVEFAPVIRDHGGTFGIDDVYVEYMPCEGCEAKRMDITLTCWADDLEPVEVLTDGLLLRYSRGAKTAPEVATCGLKVGKEVNWSNREMVLARVRGQYGDEQQMLSHELLGSFSAIPTPDNGWVWNPARGNNDLSEYCINNDQGGYVNTTYHATLPVSPGWPYRHEAEVYVTSKANGEVCTIWLTGSDDETYLRYFYNFAGGKTLVKAYTSDEPDDVSREWRWVNGEPWEFTRRQMPDSVAGHDAILYWHKTAAQLWPKRMSYKPDLKEFKALNETAQLLLSRFPAKPEQP